MAGDGEGSLTGMQLSAHQCPNQMSGRDSGGSRLAQIHLVA
jgi:hypothetical protein